MKRGNIQTLALTLAPSPVSLLVSLGVAFTIMVGHVLLLSTASGLLLPNLLQNDTELWGTVLVSWVEPIMRLLTENHIAATVAIALFWAAIGAGLYAIISSTVSAAKEARNLQDPTMRFYLQLLGWHLFVGAAFVTMSVFLAPFVRWIFTQDELLSQSATPGELASYAGSIVLSWVVLLHAYVVLYRLYRRFYIS